MEIEDLISALQSGNEREISDFSYSLMNVSDNTFLQKLAGSLELITPLLVLLIGPLKEISTACVYQ